ncbi:KpsF/GutQ family sugar-phosphate isomerase [Litorimonas sp. RW-G-Af-16]|uniref:KpsF/GutQ family sugar-phosphate isomerase n=1 Tax=Litorimonas sp. RW-G-Af-16 TaxID=3241168 RepID=UPI00390CA8E1
MGLVITIRAPSRVLSSNPQSIATQVITAEIAGLETLRASIGDSFDAAVNTILSAKNYLVVVGVGKSGHIGRKIAASFASTGTPSFFMHPTEASHGDLGMISQGCVLLALSNSGESQELRAVTAYSKGLGVPIIAITANPNSSLGKAADTILALPRVEEACPNGLAPTTSTTNTLALGDALMVAVMQARGFTQDDFGRRHPAGKLGLRLQTVADWRLAHPQDLPMITPETPMKETVLTVSRGGKGCAAVVDGAQNLIGMITDGDIRRAMEKHNENSDFFSFSAVDIMTPSPLTLSMGMRMGDVVKLFSDRRIGNAFVTDDGKPVALIDLKSLLEDGYV